MKCLVVGHVVRDIIRREGKTFERLGGGAYYSALALSRFCDVEILTSFLELPEEWVEELESIGKLHVIPSSATTTYELKYLNGKERTLKLLERASPIVELPEGNYDVVLINPVAGEVPREVIPKAVEKFPIVSVDLQGFIRSPIPGEVRYRRLDGSFLRGATVLHAECSEVEYLDNFSPGSVDVLLLSNGPETGRAFLGGTEYTFKPVPVDVEESTGAGDVFLGAFTGFYLGCSFVPALKRAAAFTALFLRERRIDFSMDEVNKLSAKVKVRMVQTPNADDETSAR